MSGANLSVAAADTPEDIWGDVSTFTGFNATSAQTVSLVSTSVLDTSAGTGARSVRLYGLNQNYELIEETVTLNGTTPVISTSQFIRIYFMEIILVGSTSSNQGDIRATQTTSSILLQIMRATGNRSRAACYTIPAATTGYVVGFDAALSLSTAVAGRVAVWTKPQGGYGSASYLTSITNTVPATVRFPVYIKLPPKTDVSLRMFSITGTAYVTGHLYLLLVAD
jgi:hypothetical protein